MVTPKDFIHGHYNGLSCICRFGDSKKLRLSDESIIFILFIFQILLLLLPSAARENPPPILHKVQATCEWPEREVATKVSLRFFSALFSIYEGPQ